MQSTCSVIITTRNRAKSLKQTLEAIAKVQIPPWLCAELLVVDNGSNDETAEVVRQFKFTDLQTRYILEPRPGQCFARNSGIAAATGDIILFVDDDVAPFAQWLGQMCLPITSGRADAVAGCVEIAPHLLRPWMNEMHRSWLASSERIDAVAPGSFVGANMAFSRKVLDRVPWFDTELGPGQLGFFDDTLFAQQIRAAGYRLISAFDARVEHRFDESRLSRKSFLDSARKRGRTLAYLNHHWWHRVERGPRLRLAASSIRLFLARLCRPGTLLADEGASAPELYHLQQVQYFRQYLRERKRPRVYDRCGLVKKASLIANSSTDGK